MKYYICSPMGRTGSKRIVFGLRASLQSRHRMFISHDENIHAQEFKLYDMDKPSKIYSKEQALQLMNEWDSPITLHSHNPTFLPTDPSGWKFILSTRKRKLDTVLSLLVSMKSNSFSPNDPIRNDFRIFREDPKNIEIYMENYIKRENTFISNVIDLTGTPPKIIYLEDSWQLVQQKVGLQFSPESEIQNTYSISNLKAVDYITNYDAIQKLYEKNLHYYKNQFITETC